jgi:hypothetical protein
MANFEVVVRPVVFPNMRPAPARSLPPEDDPTSGWVVIRSNPGKQIDLPYNWSYSMSKSRGTETERRVDVVRVYQKEDDETVNESNFVDIEVANRIKSRQAGGLRQDWYKRIEEDDNIEIKETDKIVRNPDA